MLWLQLSSLTAAILGPLALWAAHRRRPHPRLERRFSLGLALLLLAVFAAGLVFTYLKLGNISIATLVGFIAVTGGDRSKPTKLEFKEDGGKLVSSNALPEGNDYPVSVSIKANASAKAVDEKFNLDLGKCPTCKSQEYACICGQEDDDKKKK